MNRFTAIAMALVWTCHSYAVERFISTTGADQGAGNVSAPWSTPRYAMAHVNDGDTVTLARGSYDGGFVVSRRNITLRAAAGQQVSVSAPITNASTTVCIYVAKDATNCTIKGLDLSGGYYYVVMTESNWDSTDPLRYGAGHLTVDSCTIHNSGRDCIKITPASDGTTIKRCEIYNSGMRDASNAEGIDNVNGDSMLVQDCYIHDIATNGVYPKGGAIGCVIERCRFNMIQQSAIVLGQSTDWVYFDSVANPNRYECIGSIARNNIITNTGGAGLQFEAAYQCKAYNNTLVNVSVASRGAIFILGTNHYPPALGGQALFRPSTDIEVVNNLVVLPANTRPAVFIVASGANVGITGTLIMNGNRYHRIGGAPIFWDERVGAYNLSFAQWQARVGGEALSSIGDPLIDSLWHLTAGSQCIDNGLASGLVTHDVDQQPREVGACDIGADEYYSTSIRGGPSGRAMQIGEAAWTLTRWGQRCRTTANPVFSMNGRRFAGEPLSRSSQVLVARRILPGQ